MPSINELPVGKPPAGRLMRYIELVSGASPSSVPGYRKPPHLEDEIERQVDEFIKKAKVQQWTSAVSVDPVLVRKRTNDGACVLTSSPRTASL